MRRLKTAYEQAGIATAPSTPSAEDPKIKAGHVLMPNKQEKKLKALAKANWYFRHSRSGLIQASRFERAMFRLKYQFIPYYFNHPPAWRYKLRKRNWRERVAPDFAALGAVRSWTSALADYLFQHPAVVLPLAKEIPGTVISQVRAQFPRKMEMNRHRREFGEAMTGYCSPQLPDPASLYFLNRLSPNMKYVLILRNPVHRTISHYLFDKRKIQSLGVGADSVMNMFPPFSERIRLELVLPC